VLYERETMKTVMNIVAFTVLMVPAVMVAQEDTCDNRVSTVKPVTIEENKEDAQPHGKCTKGGCTKPTCKGGSCSR